MNVMSTVAERLAHFLEIVVFPNDVFFRVILLGIPLNGLSSDRQSYALPLSLRSNCVIRCPIFQAHVENLRLQ
jgi:hypothetical protein